MGARFRASILHAKPLIATPTLSFGNSCFIGHRVCFALRQGIAIGDRVGIASNVTVEDCAGYATDVSRRLHGGLIDERDCGPVAIEDSVWIGRNAYIHRGATIRRNAIVAAGSVVVGEVPEGAIAMGVPARIIRP